MKLEALGVERIHLFLAAPSSVALRFGRLYDKRNLPPLNVYQYKRQEADQNPYIWSISMPVAGLAEAAINEH